MDPKAEKQVLRPEVKGRGPPRSQSQWSELLPSWEWLQVTTHVFLAFWVPQLYQGHHSPDQLSCWSAGLTSVWGRPPTETSRGEYSPHNLWHLLFCPLPSRTEQDSPRKRPLLHSHVSVENRHCRDLQMEAGPKPEWNARGCVSKRKKGKWPRK